MLQLGAYHPAAFISHTGPVTAYLQFGLFWGYVIQNSLPDAPEIQPDPTNQIFVYFSLDAARSYMQRNNYFLFTRGIGSCYST